MRILSGPSTQHRGGLASQDESIIREENESLRRELAECRRQTQRFQTLRPAETWGEDYGSVLWWRLPIEEPPYVGLWEDVAEYEPTHWSPLPECKKGSLWVECAGGIVIPYEHAIAKEQS